MVTLDISSADRSTGSSSSFTIQTAPQLTFSKIKLLSARIQNTIYNVTTQNNVLAYLLNSSPQYPLTIPVGSYSISNLINTLNNLFNSASAGITGNYNSTTFASYFTSTQPFSFDFTVPNNCYKQLGFVNETVINSDPSHTITSPNAIDFRRQYLHKNN